MRVPIVSPAPAPTPEVLIFAIWTENQFIEICSALAGGGWRVEMADVAPGLAALEDGQITYCRADNKLYFRDGATLRWIATSA